MTKDSAHILDEESFKRLEKKVDNLDAKVTTLISLIADDSKQPDEIDAAGTLVRSALGRLATRNRNKEQM